jgi:hypothetical protein
MLALRTGRARKANGGFHFLTMAMILVFNNFRKNVNVYDLRSTYNGNVDWTNPTINRSKDHFSITIELGYYQIALLTILPRVAYESSVSLQRPN